MKRFFPLILMLILSCNTGKKEKIPVSSGAESEVEKEVLSLCFLSTANEVQVENQVLRDSVILKLEIKGKKVTGIYEWVPAEKDSRRGRFEGTKVGENITGKYDFWQEGIQDTLPINIQIKEDTAIIITNKGEIGELKMKAKKVICAN